MIKLVETSIRKVNVATYVGQVNINNSIVAVKINHTSINKTKVIDSKLFKNNTWTDYTIDNDNIKLIEKLFNFHINTFGLYYIVKDNNGRYKLTTDVVIDNDKDGSHILIDNTVYIVSKLMGIIKTYDLNGTISQVQYNKLYSGTKTAINILFENSLKQINELSSKEVLTFNHI